MGNRFTLPRNSAAAAAALLAVLGASCATPPEPTAGPGLYEVIAEEWETRLAADPLLATRVGRHLWNSRLPDASPASLERGAEADRAMLARLRAFREDELDARARLDRSMLVRQLEDRIADYEFGAWQIPINSDSGFHTEFAELPTRVPLETVADIEAYIARLQAFPTWVDQQVANMRVGLSRGMTLPRAVLTGYDEAVAVHVVDTAEESLFFGPFRTRPRAVPEAEWPRLRERGRLAVMASVIDGYRAFATFLRDEYIPNARTTIGASELPDGPAFYAQQVAHYTTLPITPREVHELGLTEVDRIKRDMVAVIESLAYSGTFKSFLQELRTDPRFYAKTPDELLMIASRIAKRADAKLPSLFGNLPRLPYGVEPVPAHLAPRYTAGRYNGPSAGSGEPGYYWVNTYALDSRPLYSLTALSLHEAVPGHHLQISLANELEGVPEFRKWSYVDAFGEGWGLYSEWLGIEMGLYDTPYDEFGRLTYEMWRACRLVVDTGLHAFGWTRDEAINYLADNTALSIHECTTEVDRYIAWPGQALAYKIGELEIRRLRSDMEQRLGARFDVRAFHDAVLSNGGVPLQALRQQVESALLGTSTR